MSIFRRLMMSSLQTESNVPDTPEEELDYLTIIPLEDGVYKIYPYGGSMDFGDNKVYTQDMPFYYRVNNGEWIEVNLPDAYELAFILTLAEGSILQLKCMGCDYNDIYASVSQMFRINSESPHNVCGTPMSLIYGDSFKENNHTFENYSSYLFYNDLGLLNIINKKTFLPYKNISYGCYEYMFYGCSRLISAPELPATTLFDLCYRQMFCGCSNLHYIKMLATDISAQYCLYGWVEGVSNQGTFIMNKDATWDVIGEDGIPEGWTVITNDKVNQISNTFSLGFPLYLEFDYCDEFQNACYRYSDEIGLALFNALKYISHEYGECDKNSNQWKVSGEILDMLGVEVYVGNIKAVKSSLFVYYDGTISEVDIQLEDESSLYIFLDGSLEK